MKPEFKDVYVLKEIIENGKCYCIRKEALKSIKNNNQKVVFALELKNENLMKIKDLTIGKTSTLETTKKSGKLKVSDGIVITTAADSFGSFEEFSKFYEESDVQIEAFIKSYSSSISNNLKVQNQKPQPKQKTRR